MGCFGHCVDFGRGLADLDKRVFEKLDVIAGQFSISVLLRGVVDDFVWACTGVYGPNDDGQRSILWEELS